MPARMNTRVDISRLFHPPPRGTRSNPAEVLLERGLAQVQRHKQGDDNRSSEFDKLMAAEQKALEAKKGVHSEKDFPAPKIGDASEVSCRYELFPKVHTD